MSAQQPIWPLQNYPKLSFHFHSNCKKASLNGNIWQSRPTASSVTAEAPHLDSLRGLRPPPGGLAKTSSPPLLPPLPFCCQTIQPNKFQIRVLPLQASDAQRRFLHPAYTSPCRPPAPHRYALKPLGKRRLQYIIAKRKSPSMETNISIVRGALVDQHQESRR